MFFDDNSQKLNLKKINAIKLAHAPHRAESGVVCTACQKPLTNEDSMIAGMGAVCLERTRFAENINREELHLIEGIKEPVNKGLYPARTAILREKTEDQPRLVTILSTQPLDAIIIDRIEMRKNYENKMSMAEAIANSLYSFMPIEAESVANIQSPKDPEVMRKFKNFQKDIRKDLKERSEYLKQNPFNSYYNQVFSKKGLTEEQLETREELLRKKDSDSNYFNDGWSKGKFHRATWMARLNQTQLSEAKLIASVLEINNSSKLGSLEIKDYGLTDQEIIMGLQHSGQALEKNLFKAFVEGNKNLLGMVEIYKVFPQIEVKDKLSVLKFMSKLANKEAFSLSEKQSLVDTAAKLKISSRLFNI